VVSTNAGGIPFIYTDGENAVLVEVGDWRGLAAAVSRLLQDEPLAHALATAGHRLCRQCDWQNIRRSLYASYGFVPPIKQEGNSDDWRVTYSRAVKERV
jgi:glycosyltransferase involved in cell wall biosynthesis